MTFRHECCRCGFCCTSEVCRVALLVGLPLERPCVALSYDADGRSVCGLFVDHPEWKEVLGIGKGCCIKARAIRGAVEYDFASLPPDIKQSVGKGTFERMNAVAS